MPVIDVLAEAQDLESYWRLRNKQLQEDRDIINLVKPLNSKNWVTNTPKVFYQTAVALLSSYTPRIRMPLSINFTADEQTKMNKAERFCLGLLRNLDNRQMSRGQASWIHELAWWVCSGWYAIFTIVRENEQGGVDFIADLWDSMTVYPEWDSDGLVKCARVFEVDKKQARVMIGNWQAKGLKTEFKDTPEGSRIKIINYWRKDYKKKEETQPANKKCNLRW